MHPEIEKLIDLAIADGQITEKERLVILKKATEFGADSDEVEMILDGKLHQQQAAKTKEKEKVGNIKVCPACGAHLNSFEGNCKDCGLELNGTNTSEILKAFIAGKKKFQRSFKGAQYYCSKCNSINTITTPQLAENKSTCSQCNHNNVIPENIKKIPHEEYCNYISQFSINPDKESVLSIMMNLYNDASLSIPQNILDPNYISELKIREAYRAKFLELYETAQLLLINDSKILGQISQMKYQLDQLIKGEAKSANKQVALSYALLLGFFLILGAVAIFYLMYLKK
jgi:hypothetical protein